MSARYHHQIARGHNRESNACARINLDHLQPPHPNLLRQQRNFVFPTNAHGVTGTALIRVAKIIVKDSRRGLISS